MKRTLVFITTLSILLFGFTSSVDAAAPSTQRKTTTHVVTQDGKVVSRTTVTKQQGPGNRSRLRDEIRFGRAATDRPGTIRITGGATAGVDITSGDGATLTTTSLQAGAAYIRPNGFEYGADFKFLTFSGNSARTTEILVLPTVGYNFGMNTEEGLAGAAYVRLGVGLFAATAAGSTDTFFTVRPLVGKRFPLGGRISWSPELSFQYIASDPTTTRIGIVPFAFTLLF